VQTESARPHHRSSFPSLWRGVVFTFQAAVAAVAVVAVGAAQAQDEVLQYAGGERDIEPLTVVTDTTVSAQLVRDLGEKFVKVESVAEAGQTPGEVELSEADREAIGQADLVVYQGLGLMPGFIAAAEKRDAKDRVVLTERVPEFRLIEDAEGTVNPYTYLSPSLRQFSVDHLTTRLKKKLEPVAGEIEGNRLRVNIELQSLDRETDGLLEDVPRSERLLVTDNRVFAYFAKDYHFQLLDVTREADGKKAIEQINRNETPTVFPVAGIGGGALEDWLEAHRGKDVPESIGLSKALDALWLGEPNLPTGTYLGQFRENVSTILLGLKPLPAAGQESTERLE